MTAAFVHVLAPVANQLIPRMAITDVRTGQIGAQLIANSLRAFVNVGARSIFIAHESRVALASVRAGQIGATVGTRRRSLGIGTFINVYAVIAAG